MIAPPDEEDDAPAHLKGHSAARHGRSDRLDLVQRLASDANGPPRRGRGWLNLHADLSMMIRMNFSNRVDDEIFRQIMSIGRPDPDEQIQTESET